MKVTSHVAQNKSGHRSALADQIAQSESYAILRRKRKLIEQGFGWAKLVGPGRQVMVRGIQKVDRLFALTMASLQPRAHADLGGVRPLAPPSSVRRMTDPASFPRTSSHAAKRVFSQVTGDRKPLAECRRWRLYQPSIQSTMSSLACARVS